jgi:hypothetical protein
MTHSLSTAAPVLPEVAGYQVHKALAPGTSWLASGSAGRKVVLKVLDADCMLRGQLHASVRDRLNRVRELAHVGVANLLGVEKGDQVYLVWEYVEGRIWNEWIADASSKELRVAAAQELILAVELLHAQGIVHGALHGNNIIVNPQGNVRLTHISPLLYDDPRQDEEAIAQLLREYVPTTEGDDRSNLARLREVLQGVGVSHANPPAQSEAGAGIRKRALVAAAATTLLGAGITYGVIKWVHHRSPAPIIAPDAGPTAMQEREMQDNR